jgi:Fe-S cluster biogenesis protein NfuA
VNVRTIGDDIERLLDELQAKLDPRAFEQSVELVQLVTELYGAGMARIVELAGESLVDDAPRFVRRLADDDLVASLLVVHGLHPDGLAQRVAAALDGVRPFLGGHGGDVELLDIDEEVGAVHLRLLGSCDGCPSSAVTLRLTVERAIFEAAPEISIIDVDEPTPEPVRTPVTMMQKSGSHAAETAAHDPATGCGAML